MTLFFRSKLKHRDEKVRLNALEKLKDEDVIVEVACRDASPNVRLAAVRKLTNPGHLATVVRMGQGEEARVEAVGRIQDQELLAQILLERKNHAIMQAAFEGITDPAVLKRIAEDDRYNIAARRTAIENFADQSFLEEIARNVTTPGVKEAALKQLSAEGSESVAETESLAGQAPDAERTETILERYGSERIVEAIGKFRGSEKAIRSLGLVARKGTVGCERAIHFLEKALDHSNPHIRACALEELSSALSRDELDPLIENSLKDPDPNVRELAGRIQKSVSSA